MTNNDLSQFTTEALEAEVAYRKRKFTVEDAWETLNEILRRAWFEYSDECPDAEMMFKIRRLREGLEKCFADGGTTAPCHIFDKEKKE